MGRKAAEIARSLPNAVDLLTIGLEAGWSMNQSAQYIIDHYHTPFSEELRAVYTEVGQGRDTAPALRAMAQRCGLPEVDTLVSTIITCQATGAELAPLLRIQAEEIRRRRRARVEAKVRTAPMKMTVAMAGCIFPAIFAAVLAPAVVSVLKALHGG